MVAARRVRVTRRVMNDPAFGSSATHDTLEEHPPVVAAHAVIMAGYIAADPSPHKAPSGKKVHMRRSGKSSATVSYQSELFKIFKN
jgi:hypothetical protein